MLVLHADAYSGRGRADTFTLAYGCPVFIEFKTEVGHPRPLQPEFLRDVRKAGGYSFLARDANLALRAVKHLVAGRRPYMSEDLELSADFLAELDALGAALEEATAPKFEPGEATIGLRPDAAKAEMAHGGPHDITNYFNAEGGVVAGIPDFEEPPPIPEEVEAPKRARGRGRPKTDSKEPTQLYPDAKPRADGGPDVLSVLQDVIRALTDEISRNTFEMIALRSELARQNDASEE